MPPKYSDSVRNIIETCLRAGVEPLKIASEVHVTYQWVYHLRQALDAFDTVSPPPPPPPPPPAAALGHDARSDQYTWIMERWTSSTAELPTALAGL
jgi:hypothetical protein